MPATVTIVDLNAGAANQGVAALCQLVTAAGAHPVVVDLRIDHKLPSRPGQAVLLTGGPGSPTEAAPWRRRLQATLPALSRRVPVLGICLGFQVMARAFGWRLGTLPSPRFGLYHLPLGTRPDPLLPALPLGSAVFEQRRWAAWAQPGAQGRQLARGVNGDALAVRFTASAAGVVFHPEAAPAAVERWFATDANARAKAVRTHGPGGDQRQLDACPALAPAWTRTVPGFLAAALCRGEA